MKLFIVRDQAKKMLGGISFQLSARVELSSEEADLVKKYKMDKEVLLEKEVKIPLTGRSIALNITIGSLMQGQSFKCNDIAEILGYEENVKESCKTFKNYIEVMKHFGGEEVVEY
ncbi:conserved hypothetical protein [Desulfamplus magnetovallimortis]|uniref:Uncharacterized protein n=1 Tax=Desulfamplus magnetovallimortis TaxID=1246637 RepID=A0A1W1H8D3_9BACT|nr:hypothetical protein [Desulfamplus magnetovallimortis]SLM28722.1 conserved hypothetical protein [Desulfamplus magnetovallimortis]